MRLTYWKRYDRLFKKFSGMSLFKLVLEFAQRLGAPYQRKGKDGPKEKVSAGQYVAYIVFMIFRGATYREMETDSSLYLGVHIDHSTFAVNLDKMPTEYFLDLIESTGSYLDFLLSRPTEYVIDSTAITTPITFETVIKGKTVTEHVEYRTHIIASLHPEEQALSIRQALPTTKHVADCEAAKRMLDQRKISHIRLHADPGYDYERVYQSCNNNSIQTNIHPQDYTSKKDHYRLEGLAGYNDLARKKHRGLIETIFGGLTNAGLLTTRLKKNLRILAYSTIILIRHNILTIAKNI